MGRADQLARFAIDALNCPQTLDPPTRWQALAPFDCLIINQARRALGRGRENLYNLAGAADRRSFHAENFSKWCAGCEPRTIRDCAPYPGIGRGALIYFDCLFKKCPIPGSAS